MSLASVDDVKRELRFFGLEADDVDLGGYLDTASRVRRDVLGDSVFVYMYAKSTNETFVLPFKDFLNVIRVEVGGVSKNFSDVDTSTGEVTVTGLSVGDLVKIFFLPKQLSDFEVWYSVRLFLANRSIGVGSDLDSANLGKVEEDLKGLVQRLCFKCFILGSGSLGFKNNQ